MKDLSYVNVNGIIVKTCIYGTRAAQNNDSSNISKEKTREREGQHGTRKKLQRPIEQNKKTKIKKKETQNDHETDDDYNFQQANYPIYILIFVGACNKVEINELNYQGYLMVNM